MVSFRTRIRRAALAYMVVLLGLFSLTLYVGLSTILHHHIDEDLLALAEQESHQVELATGHVQLAPFRQAEHASEDEPEAFDDEEELQRAIRSSTILDERGAVIWSGTAIEQRPDLDPALLKTALQGQPVYETLESANRIPIRRISIPIIIEDHGRFILQTEKSLEFVQDTLRWLTWLLVGACASLLVLAWWGSGRLAEEALAPVESLSQTAAGISETTLANRLNLTAPFTEFQRLTSAFNGMLDRLQHVFDGQRRFVADAAHELKTPLTAMKGNLEVVLQRPRSSHEYREAIVSALGEVDRLTILTKSLLTLAQFASERPPLHLQPFDFSALVRDVVTQLSVLADDRNIHLEAEYFPMGPFMGDPSLLKQALINLLDNALRYTPEGGTIAVRLSSQGTIAMVSISDTGPGIDEKHLPHVFDRFYRIDQARDRRSGGTGLGLAIVKEIVEAHRGQIHVQSTVGAGTTFTITLPMETPVPAQSER